MAGEKRIKSFERLNYFDGLFLDAAKFKLEADYHVEIRRYLNFLLFNAGILYTTMGEEPLEVKPQSGTVLTIAKGSAMVRDQTHFKGFEVYLASDTTLDLSTPDFGLADGDKAYITAGWEGKAESSAGAGAGGGGSSGSGVLVTGNDLTREYAVINASKTAPGPSDPLVLLAEVTYHPAPTGISDPDIADKRVRGGLRYEILSQDLLDKLSGAPVTLVSVAVSPASGNVETGKTLQLTLIGSYSDGSTQPVSSGVAWSSGNPGRATVSAAGLVTGVATGPVTITGTANGKSATASITVTAALVSINVSPSTADVEVGKTVALAATGTYSDTSTGPLGPPQLNWSSSNPAVATISGGGVVTGVSVGSATITASVGAITDTASVTVKPPAVQPVISFLNPTKQASGGFVDIVGQNLRNPSILPTQPAVGTTVTLRKGVNQKPALNPTARPNDASGRQVVRVTIPNRTGTPWGSTEAVTLQLSFGGGNATTTFTYDD